MFFFFKYCPDMEFVKKRSATAVFEPKKLRLKMHTSQHLLTQLATKVHLVWNLIKPMRSTCFFTLYSLFQHFYIHSIENYYTRKKIPRPLVVTVATNSISDIFLLFFLLKKRKDIFLSKYILASLVFTYGPGAQYLFNDTCYVSTFISNGTKL